jgi:hypothetical protein
MKPQGTQGLPDLGVIRISRTLCQGMFSSKRRFKRRHHGHRNGACPSRFCWVNGNFNRLSMNSLGHQGNCSQVAHILTTKNIKVVGLDVALASSRLTVIYDVNRLVGVTEIFLVVHLTSIIRRTINTQKTKYGSRVITRKDSKDNPVGISLSAMRFIRFSFRRFLMMMRNLGIIHDNFCEIKMLFC